MNASPPHPRSAVRLLPPAAMAALSEGDLGLAIRITHDLLGVDDKEAQALVDEYVAHNPDVREKLREPATIWTPERLIVAALVVCIMWWVAIYLLAG